MSKYPVFAMLITHLPDVYSILSHDGTVFSLYQDEVTVPKCPRSAFFKLQGMINASGSLTTFLSRIVVING